MSDVPKVPLPDGIQVAGPLQFDVVIDVDEDGKIIPKPPLPDALKPNG